MASSTTARGPGRTPGKLSGLLDTLYNEHRYILALLDNLEQQTLRLKSGKVPDYQLLLDSIDYLTHYPDRYHHSREDLLFAEMLKQDGDFTTHIKRLQREHATLRTHNNRLFAELSSAVQGAPVDRPALLRKLRTYIKHYRQHIHYESHEIFPRARGSLRPALLNAINDKTRYLDDPLFGDRVNRQYHRLARDLNLRVTNLRDEVLLREYLTLETLLETATRAGDRVSGLARMPNPFKLVSPRPSWQARAMNLFTRSVMKPVMRYGSLDSLRAITLRADELGEKNLPPDIKSAVVNHADYQAEWIRIKGKRPRKVLLYLPGGGFIIRTAVQHREFVARMCRVAGTKALLVHYSLAPEVPFPGGLEDCLAAYHDLLRQGYQADNITLAGDSAGGGLVLSTLLALRDEGTKLPARAIVLSPLADLAYRGNSRLHNKRADPVLPTQRIAAMQALYIGESLPDNRYAAPVLADFDGLPPILGIVGSTEILLDDTLRAALQAGRADVPFYLEVWEKMPHVFPIFSVLPESKVAIERIGKFIREGQLQPLPSRYGRHKATHRERRALAHK